MPKARPSSGPMIPWMLGPLVHLLLWGRERLKAIAGPLGTNREESLDVVGALLLVGVLPLVVILGVPPIAALAGGIGTAILLVVARSWAAVQERKTA